MDGLAANVRSIMKPRTARNGDILSVCILPLAIALIASLGIHAAPRASMSGSDKAPALPASLERALARISTNDLLQHLQVLSSDEFEGRAPGSRGEELTVNYLVNQFKKFRLKPGNPDGTFVQNVPLMGFTAQPTILFDTRAGPMNFGFPNDCVILSRRQIPETRVENSDVVFVGYGVVAPEYGWDDYKDVDVRGKTIVMLINDPAIPDPSDPAKLDETQFRGRAMTYYGRWTYKYEIATAKGAAAAIIVHETGPAGYPWFVVVGGNSRENFDLQTPDRNLARVPIEGWITLDNARKLSAAGGHSFEILKRSALKRDFRPVPLNCKATFTVQNALRAVASRNVIAKLPGSDPKLRNEYVIYTAHWDHLGRNTKLEGDQIFNGAYDNASGTAGLLELAEAFTSAKPAPKRTILFLALTAEEKGLLGAKYYAEHPLYPLERTLANINMDGINVLGRTRDLGLVGIGQSTLEDTLRSFVVAQGRELLPEAEPEKGYFFRSDHFEFAKQGVPALYVDEGINFIGQPADFGKRKREEYIDRDYHKVTDEIKADWDLAGGVEDLQLLFRVGYAVAQSSAWPEWKEGSEFRAQREAMLKKQN